MTFARYFKASSYCLICSSFIAVVSTGDLGLVPSLLFSTVLLCSWFLDTEKIHNCIPPLMHLFIAAACILFLIIDFRLLSHSLELTFLHLLLLIAGIKLLTLSNDRDYLILYLTGLAELLAAATRTVDLVFGICLLLFLVSGVSSLILFEMRRSNAKLQREAGVHPLIVPRELQGTGMELFSHFHVRAMLAITAGISLLIIAVAIPLFLLLPRVGTGSFRNPSGRTQFTTGFSERVELGHIGTIKQSDTVVMRVKTNRSIAQLPADLKWRGLAFDHYDGRVWTRSTPSGRVIPMQGWYYKIENSAQGTDLIDQTFFIEALSTDVIFAAHKVLAISRDAGPLRNDSSGNLFATQHLYNKMRYSAVSDPINPNPAIITDAQAIPSEIMTRFTQVPPGDPRIAALAKQVTYGNNNRYTKAQAVERYLLSHYRYSLTLRGTPNSRDPLAMFLFDVREGHCEYFATAMTVMLRRIGIPARLVNGFRQGEYNTISDSWIVRQYDAHSWVEAYIPPYGWIEFDPTPPDLRRPQPAFIRLLSNLADAVDLWWWENIVNYDATEQYRTVIALQNRMVKFQDSVKKTAETAFDKFRMLARSTSIPAQITLWITALIIAALLVIRPVRQRIISMIRRMLHPPTTQTAAVAFYKEALALLGRYGIERSPDQTPLEFAQTLDNHPAGLPFMSLTRMYNAIRFGPQDIHFPTMEAAALLQSLRNSLQKQEPGARS
jgi:protein-glutamine gamma-glutamyltransferase